MADITVTDNPAESRFEAHLDGKLVGIAEYRLFDGVIDFIHTEVLAEGLGVGGAIARGALDQVRAAGERQVIPHCEFIRGWMVKHPDYLDMVHERGLKLLPEEALTALQSK